MLLNINVRMRCSPFNMCLFAKANDALLLSKLHKFVNNYDTEVNATKLGG